MNDVMIISDYRDQLSKLCLFLEDERTVNVHVVPYSINGIDRFLQVLPEIIILDTGTFVPYQDLVKYFVKSPYAKKIILLAEFEDQMNSCENVHFIMKDTLDRKKLLRTLNNTIGQLGLKSKLEKKNNPYPLNTLSSDRDIYSVFFIVAEEDEISTDKLKSNLDEVLIKHERVEYIKNEDGNFILVVPREYLKGDNSLEKFTVLLFESFLKSIGIVYLENVHKSTMDKVIVEFERINDKRYFIQNQAYSLHQLESISDEIDRSVIDEILKSVFQAVLNGNREGVRRALRELFLSLLKYSCCDESVKYARIHLGFYMDIFSRLLGQDAKLTKSNFKSLEKEYEYLIERFLSYSSQVKDRKISHVVIESLIYLVNNYNQEISLNDAAVELNMSKIYVSRIFKEYTKETFVSVLQKIRVEIAKYLLIETDMKVYEISDSLGYQGSKYFSRLYKNIVGMSPLEYRETKGFELIRQVL